MNRPAVAEKPPARIQSAEDQTGTNLGEPAHGQEAPTLTGPEGRAAFLQRCEEIALRLAASSAEERAQAYSSGAFSYRELSTAAALRPDLVPLVNGEWEWIGLTIADRE